MRLSIKPFLLFIPLIPVGFAFVLLVGPPKPEGRGASTVSPQSPKNEEANPIVDRVRWENYLRERPELGPYRDTLLILSERLPIETFARLSPRLQIRLARFAQSRRNPIAPPTTVCWAPGVPLSVMEAFHAVEEMAVEEGAFEISAATQFDDLDRWEQTATFNDPGENAEQGLPTTLTWSFVPDDTSIFGFNGEDTSPSDLIAFLDDRYSVTNGGNDLTNRPWFAVFQAAFDNISELTGMSYVYEPNDDGAAFFQNSLPSGSLGVRGDVRIAGHFIDGQSGSNVLAYNFNAGFGEMVIDTGNINFYGNLTSDSLNLRNVVEHEHGHGLGLRHVCPINQTKLMEPFISRQFRGLQLDDIFSLNRLYGDFYEKQDSDRDNDSSSNAATLPAAAGVPFEREYLSIDDNSDTDFYRLENVPAGSLVTCRVIPVATPTGFVEGPQNTNGSCSSGTSFDFTSVHDLQIEILASNGSSALATANSQPAGMTEEIDSFKVQGTGTLFLRIEGDNTDSTQLYTLQIEIVEPTPFEAWAIAESIPEALAAPDDDADADGLFNLQEYYFGLSPLIPDPANPVTSAISPDGNSYFFTFPRDPNATIATVIFEISDDLSLWLPYLPDPGQISVNPIGDQEEVSITIPTHGESRFLRLGLEDSD